MSYVWQGKTYRTQQEVAEASGRHVNTVLRHLKQFGDLESLGTFTQGISRRVELDGRSWPSVTSFAEYCGVHQRSAHFWIRHSRFDLMRRAVARAEARGGAGV